jgi:hypothetical protein
MYIFFPLISLLHDEKIIFPHNNGTDRGPLRTLACLIHILIFTSKCSLSSIHIQTQGKTKSFTNEHNILGNDYSKNLSEPFLVLEAKVIKGTVSQDF